MADKELSELQDNGEDGNIQNTGNVADNSAESRGNENSGSEDAQGSAIGGFASIIDNQNKIIDALTEQNAKLSEQIQGLLRNGASVTPENERKQMPEPDNAGLPENYIPLADLGKEIGKKN